MNTSAVICEEQNTSIYGRRQYHRKTHQNAVLLSPYSRNIAKDQCITKDSWQSNSSTLIPVHQQQRRKPRSLIAPNNVKQQQQRQHHQHLLQLSPTTSKKRRKEYKDNTIAHNENDAWHSNDMKQQSKLNNSYENYSFPSSVNKKTKRDADHNRDQHCYSKNVVPSPLSSSRRSHRQKQQNHAARGAANVTKKIIFKVDLSADDKELISKADGNIPIDHWFRDTALIYSSAISSGTTDSVKDVHGDGIKGGNAQQSNDNQRDEIHSRHNMRKSISHDINDGIIQFYDEVNYDLPRYVHDIVPDSSSSSYEKKCSDQLETEENSNLYKMICQKNKIVQNKEEREKRLTRTPKRRNKKDAGSENTYTLASFNAHTGNRICTKSIASNTFRKGQLQNDQRSSSLERLALFLTRTKTIDNVPPKAKYTNMVNGDVNLSYLSPFDMARSYPIQRSTEMQMRLKNHFDQKVGTGMWNDEVTSVLARCLDSNLIYSERVCDDEDKNNSAASLEIAVSEEESDVVSVTDAMSSCKNELLDTYRSDCSSSSSYSGINISLNASQPKESLANSDDITIVNKVSDPSFPFDREIYSKIISIQFCYRRRLKIMTKSQIIISSRSRAMISRKRFSAMRAIAKTNAQLIQFRWKATAERIARVLQGHWKARFRQRLKAAEIIQSAYSKMKESNIIQNASIVIQSTIRMNMIRRRFLFFQRRKRAACFIQTCWGRSTCKRVISSMIQELVDNVKNRSASKIKACFRGNRSRQQVAARKASIIFEEQQRKYREDDAIIEAVSFSLRRGSLYLEILKLKGFSRRRKYQLVKKIFHRDEDESLYFCRVCEDQINEYNSHSLKINNCRLGSCPICMEFQVSNKKCQQLDPIGWKSFKKGYHGAEKTFVSCPHSPIQSQKSIARLFGKSKTIKEDLECVRLIQYHFAFTAAQHAQNYFRKKFPPRFSCPQCKMPFAVYSKLYHHMKGPCNRGKLRSSLNQDGKDTTSCMQEDVQIHVIDQIKLSSISTLLYLRSRSGRRDVERLKKFLQCVRTSKIKSIQNNIDCLDSGKKVFVQVADVGCSRMPFVDQIEDSILRWCLNSQTSGQWICYNHILEQIRSHGEPVLGHPNGFITKFKKANLGSFSKKKGLIKEFARRMIIVSINVKVINDAYNLFNETWMTETGENTSELDGQHKTNFRLFHEALSNLLNEIRVHN